jgi:predicted small secreted protein
MMKRTGVPVAAIFAAVLLSGCGADPAGPDVRGMTLPDAKAKLAEAGVEVSTHATDAAFGILVEENFVVCDVEAVNERMVRLEVAKHDC